MKNMKWLLFAVLLASLAVLVVACGGGGATAAPQPEATQATGGAAPTAVQAEPTKVPTTAPTNTPPPTPTVEPTAEPTAAQPESLNPSAIVAVSSLDSYRSTTSIALSGTKASKQVKESIDLKTEFTKNPAAEHLSVTSASTEQVTGTGTIEIYQVGSTEYLNMGGQWMTVPVSGTNDMMSANFLTGNTLVQDTCGWSKAGNESVGGVNAVHYQMSKDAVTKCPSTTKALFGNGTLTDASGDVYIAADGNYVLKMDMVFQGTSFSLFGGTPESASIDQGSVEIHYAITDVNQPFTIEVPPDALKSVGLPADIPAPSDAGTVTQAFGMITFTSASTPQQVSDFYKAEMPNNGWTAGNASEAGGIYSLEFTKGARTASFTIMKDPKSSGTTVLITVQGQ